MRQLALAQWDAVLGGGMTAQAREAYAAGLAGLLDVLDAMRADGDARRSRVELLASLVRSEVELLIALGRPGD